jgi:hypothetical protein
MGGTTMKITAFAEKQIEKRTEGEYVFTKTHRVGVGQDIISVLFWWAEHFDYGDDYELDYGRGMCACNFDGDLDLVEVDAFLEAVEERLSDESWFDEEEQIASCKAELEPLKKWKGYKIMIDRVTEEFNGN